jgi:hypothetical protein
MADDTFDSFSSVFRLSEAAEKKDDRVAEVLALHFALERELDEALSKIVVRPERVLTLGFANKLRLLHAVWPGQPDRADAIFQTLNAFNELRNAFAHGNVARIAACDRNLRNAYREIDPTAAEPLSYGFIAQGICLVLSDGPLPGELRQLVENFHKAVHYGFSVTSRAKKMPKQ